MNRNDLLTTAEVARLLRVAPGTLRNWRTYGGGPAWLKLGGAMVRYRYGEVLRWVERNAERHG